MLPYNYFIPVWYTLQSERDSLRPASFLLKPLAYRHLALIQTTYQLPKDAEFKIPMQDIILHHSIIDTSNVDSNLPLEILIEELPIPIKKELTDTVIRLFFLTEQDKKEINKVINFTLTDRFQDDTWRCNVCKEKGLDKQRNCPLLSEKEQEEYYNDSFFIPFNGEKLTQCPVGTLNNELMVAVNEAYGLMTNGFLPEQGGFGDQTMFFGYASQVMHRKVEKYKADKLEESRSS